MDCAWRPRTKVKSDRSNIDSAGSGGHGLWRAAVLSAVVGPGLALLSGCVAQQADLKQTERELQRRIKQTTEEQAQNRARQNQEIVSLREQDIPSLRGDVDKAIHRTQSLEAKQDDLMAKLAFKIRSSASEWARARNVHSKRVSDWGGSKSSW